MAKYLFPLMIIICFQAYAQDIQPVSWWESKLEQDTTYSYPLDLGFSKSKDSWQFYKLAYGLDAYNAMFLATGKRQYLERSLLLIENMIETSVVSKSLTRSQFKDSYRGWANRSHEENGDDGKEYPLFESFCWRYVTATMRIIKESPDLMQIDKYRISFDRILEFTEANIYEKWMTRGKDNIYRSNAHMFSHWARICLDLWSITGKLEYKKVADDYDDLLNNQWYKNVHTKNSYWWTATWSKERRGLMQRIFVDKSKFTGIKGQDVPHGNAVVSYVIEAFELGQFYRKRDIDRLVVTFNNVVWKDGNHVALYLDGSGNSQGKISDGFMKLGRYDIGTQKRLENFKLAKNTVYNRWAQFYANGALNAKYLLKGQ